ncbi:MAG TPA: type II toxin-antitoxin system VapC family toxin, partial [Anaerolineales bacterium]|nr:type II toxin-antitoxin system VapC family toxin [Anaerolineales bacterium]
MILDTDHCIAILRQKLDLSDHIAADEELYITSITVAELTHGAHRSLHREDNLTRLEVLFAAMTVLSFDEMAGRRFGHLKAELEEKGEPLDDLDLQIASIALEHDLPLVTNNERHFNRIENLKLENWIG